MAQNQDLLDVALSAARAAAAFIRSVESPPEPDAWDLKAKGDFVTAVDREAERLITGRLLDAVPDSIVVGEELSPEAHEAEIRWFVDPLDGTKNYLHGFPAYGVSVAAEVRGALSVGVVIDVARGREYRAAAGEGAWCDGRRLTVSSIERPDRALLGTGFPFKPPALEQLDRYLRQLGTVLAATAGIRRAGSAALDLAHVAEGRFEAFWELWLAPWDVAGGIVLIREAGGIVTDLDGSPRGAEFGPVVAGNPAMHGWLLDRLRAAREAAS